MGYHTGSSCLQARNRRLSLCKRHCTEPFHRRSCLFAGTSCWCTCHALLHKTCRFPYMRSRNSIRRHSCQCRIPTCPRRCPLGSLRERTSSPCSTCPLRRTQQCRCRSSHCCRPSTGLCRRWSASDSGSCPDHRTMTCSCAGHWRRSDPCRPSCCRDKCRLWCLLCRKHQRRGPSRCRPCGGLR